MPLSPNVETREVLLPSPDTVHGHCGEAVTVTTHDHHSVRVGVRDGAGITVRNNVTNLIMYSLLTALNTYRASCLRGKPGSCVPSGVTRVVVLLTSLL